MCVSNVSQSVLGCHGFFSNFDETKEKSGVRVFFLWKKIVRKEIVDHKKGEIVKAMFLNFKWWILMGLCVREYWISVSVRRQL